MTKYIFCCWDSENMKMAIKPQLFWSSREKIFMSDACVYRFYFSGIVWLFPARHAKPHSAHFTAV